MSNQIHSPKQIADMLLLYRQKKKMTQAEIAKKVGIKQATVSNFENYPNNTKLATLFKIVQALDLSINIVDKSKVKKLNDNDW